MLDEDMVDTMGDDIMDEMGLRNGNIYDDSDSSCGRENEMDDETYYLYDSLEITSQKPSINYEGGIQNLPQPCERSPQGGPHTF